MIKVRETKRRNFPTLLLLMVLFLACPLPTFPDSTQKRILMISSYHPSFPTFRRQVEGVRDTFRGSGAQIDVEFMDSKRFYQEDVQGKFYNLLSAKLKRLPRYDGIITADDNALTFVLAHHEDLFQSTPVVFFGVNNRKTALDQNRNELVSGVVEAVSMEDTLRCMTDIFPDTNTIYALVDRTPSGQGDLETFYEYRDSFPLDEISLKDLSFDELGKRLEGLKEGELVLLLSAYHDREGRSLSFEESLALIVEHSPVPVFHLWYHGMDEGIFGGKLISQYVQAEKAAGIMKQVLYNGTPVGDFPVIEESPNVYVFDYEQMKRFGIRSRNLPEGSTIINLPYSFYHENKLLIWSIIVVIIIQTSLIILLVINFQKKRKLARSLKSSEKRFRDLFEYAPVALFEEDFSEAEKYLDSLTLPDGTTMEACLKENPSHVAECAALVRVLDVNKEAIRLFEAGSKEELLEGLPGIFSEQSLEAFGDGLNRLYRGDMEFSAVGAQKTLTGRHIWTQVKTVHAPSNSPESSILFVGMLDITRAVEFQKRLEVNLKEKDILLREIHHRVNNNLALILSILHLQKIQTQNAEASGILNDLMQRIRAMALVHDKLYSRKSSGDIDLSDYINKLVSDLVQAYYSHPQELDLHIECEKIYLSRDFLIPLGLTVNEIVSNSLKHAFDEEERPGLSILIRMKGKADIELDISDNGKGISEEALKQATQNERMGVLIIDSLLQQLKGEKQLFSDRGTRYLITIPVSSTEEPT